MPDKRYLKTLGFNNGQPYYVPEKLSELTDDVGYALTTEIPTQVSELENDADYLVPEDIEDKANESGEYDDIVAGTAKQLLSSIYTTNTQPYLFRPTPADSDRERVRRLEGLSVGWNQLTKSNRTEQTQDGLTCTCNGDGSITLNGTATGRSSFNLDATNELFPIGHVFLICGYKKVGSNQGYLGLMGFNVDSGNGGIWKNTTQYDKTVTRIDYVSGDTFNNVIMWPQIIDLTLLFGSTIADHIYSLEQATAGSGVAWVKQYIDLDSYHAYSAPTIKSVEGLESHVMVGFNQFDKNTVVNGKYITSSGVEASSALMAHTDYIRVFPNTTYYTNADATGMFYTICLYDASKTFIKALTYSGPTTFNTENASYVIINTGIEKTSVDNLVVNLSDPSRNGTYEPYEKHSYPLDSTITLRGIPKLVDGQLKADGDWYEPDGKQTVRYAEVDLGTLTWVYDSTYQRFNSTLTGAKVPGYARMQEMMCGKYVCISDGRAVGDVPDKSIYRGTNQDISVHDSAYTDAATFKTAMDGVYLVYELATPTTSTASPYTEVQICESGGTEEFVTDSPVPVGHLIEYSFDIRGQVEKLKAPTTDGTYKYQCTVVNGKPTYSWVSDS